MTTTKKNINIERISRTTALSALSDVLKIVDELTIDSIDLFNSGHFHWSTAAKIDIGFDIRKNLLAVQSLARDNLDDQVFIIYRTIFENCVAIEYLSKKTHRGKRALTPTQKAFLFKSFPLYSRGLIEPAFQKSKDFKRIALRRKRLVNDDKYWHGSNLRAPCEELDKRRRDGKSPHLDSYLELYRYLSYIAHPNSRESVHYSENSLTGQICLRPYYHFDSTIFFATLWASKGIRRWAVAVRTKKTTQIDELVNSWKPLLK